jgi:hypothetical protein
MTWYANRIYVNASERALAALRAERALVGHLFLLQGGVPASWEDGACELPLPCAGLLVAREIGPGDDDDAPGTAAIRAVFGETAGAARRGHGWYAPGDWLSWAVLSGPSSVDVMDPAGVEGLEACDRPPVPFLRFLADLHARTGEPVMYYLCRTWGGEREGEAAWVFAEREVFYGDRNPDETVAIGRDGRRVVRDDVLRLALAHHGLHLPTSWFAPHTRGFDWERRRL